MAGLQLSPPLTWRPLHQGACRVWGDITISGQGTLDLDTPPHHCTPADLCVTCGAVQLLSLCCQAKLKLKITKMWALNWLQETKFLSPSNLQMKQDRQWLSEYQSPDQLSLSSAGLIFALQPAPGILQSRQHCRLCRLQCCSRVGAGRRAGIPPRPRSRAIWPLQIL